MRSLILWIIALVLTLASAWYQRRTGPSYPVEGTDAFAGTSVRYTLTRTHGGDGDQDVPIIVPDAKIQGRIVFRRFKTNDNWTGLPMERQGDKLVGKLPHQPPAGKLEYYVELKGAGDRLILPRSDGTVVTRFKGAVPDSILFPHIIIMFLAMLFSMRAGLEALSSTGRPRSYALWTFTLLIVGGLILGPAVQKFAFGEYWTGFPFGMDLTDNKTLIAFIGWLIGVSAVWNRGYTMTHPRRRWLIVVASIVMLAVYLIPHSVMGSEIDYSKADSRQAAPQYP